MGCSLDRSRQLPGWRFMAVPRPRYPLQCAAALGSPRLSLVALPPADSPSLALVPWSAAGNNRAPGGAAHLVPDREHGGSSTLTSGAADDAPATDASAPTGVHRPACGLGGQCLDPPDPRWRPLAPGMVEETTAMRRWALPQLLPRHGQRSF